MTRRAQVKAAMRVNTVRVRSCCHAFCLVFFESTLLYREGDVEKNPGPTDSVASNGAAHTRSDSDRHDNDNDTNLSGIAASIKTHQGTDRHATDDGVEIPFHRKRTELRDETQSTDG